MQWKWVFLCAAAVLAGVAGGALSLRHRPPPAAPRAAGAALPAASEVTLSGKVRPQHITGVGTEAEGNIEIFLADVGQEVYQGQALARIGAAGLESAREAAANAVDRAQEQVTKAEGAVASARLEASRADADAQRARAQADRAQAVYSRQQMLFREGATPRLTYERAQQESESFERQSGIIDAAARAARDGVRIALEQLAGAKKTLEERAQALDDAETAAESAELRSPVDGLVVGRNGEAGKPAREAGQDIFQIATDLSAMEVAVEPRPPELKRIRAGQPALVLVPELQSAGMPGVVKEIKGTEVVIAFRNPLPALRPGMQADVRLKVE